MFPSSNNYHPFPLTTNSMPGTSLTSDKNSAASSMDSPFWPFQPSFVDDDDGFLMSHLLSQAQNHQIFTSSTNNMAAPDSVHKAAASSPIKETKKVITKKKRNGSNGPKQGIPRKRTGKKDRHSKIYTAHGPRDRRMRLSLQIARKFFDLQDMLGFDKASKTIEWLFSKSKASIKELTDNLPGVGGSCGGGGGAKHVSCSGGGGGKSVSSTSESEVVSAAKECEENMGGKRESVKSRAKDTQEIKSRKVWFNPVARESRDKARARARERTREKMKMKMKMKGLEKTENCSDESNPNELSPNSLCPSIDQIKVKAVIGEEEHQSTGQLAEQQIDSISIIEKFLGITRAPRSPSPSPSPFNYQHSTVDSSGENSEENCPIILLGNWGMNNERVRRGHHEMTSIRESTGNAIAQPQNPNPSSVIFMTDTNANGNGNTQNGNPNYSNLMVNSYAKLVVTSSNANAHAHEGSLSLSPSSTTTPSSILMPTSNLGLHSHSHNNYQQNVSKYYNFY